MTKRLKWPLAQIARRARANPSQARKAMTPGTSGRFNLDHSDGPRGRRDLSSSDVEVSCNREPPPWLSQRGRANSWPGARSLPERRPTLCLLQSIRFAKRARGMPCRDWPGTTLRSKDVVAAGSAQDTVGGDARPASEQRPSGPAAIRRRVLASAAIVLAVALLFVAYLQVSRTYPENSDESNILLMAWDMLHGNVLLHGWSLSDVSFYTTELPQYVMLERFIGLHTGTAHIAAAMTYTLVVVLAALLARGTASGRDGWLRMLLTTGIMFAPQLGVAVFILLLSLGHIGTAVPVMLTWLALDRLDGLKPRWPVPVLVGLMLTWALIADPLVLIIGIVPLVAVCAARVIRGAAVRRRAGRDSGWLRASLAAQCYE